MGSVGIPQAWRRKVVLAERITAMADGLFVAGGGEVDWPGWPHDDFVHAWWVEPGRLLAGENPGDADPVRARERVNLLVDAGVRTFVDLTTPEDPLAPYERVLAEVGAMRRLELRRVSFPIPDFDVVEDDRYDEVLELIGETSGRGGGCTYVHCWGGIGRTGTVIGCVLAAQGLGYDEVVDRLSVLRSGTSKASRSSPEGDRQHAVLERRSRRRG